MSRIIASVVLSALLVASAGATIIIAPPTAAFTGVYQNQDMLGNLDNVIGLIHGDNANNNVFLTLHNDQNVNNFPHVVSTQIQDGDLWQNALTSASCGVVETTQSLDATGSQAQMVGGSVDPKFQGEILGIQGVQTGQKTEGQGNLNLVQGAILQEGQVATNSAGTAVENSFIQSAQVSVAGGTPGTQSVVGSTVNAQTAQTQMVY